MRLNSLSAITCALAKAGLTAGTTNTYTTTAAVATVFKGKFGTAFGTKTNQATPTTDYRTGAAFTALAINEGCVFVWGCIADGTVKVVQGSIEDLDSNTGAFKVAPQFPSIPDLMCPFGYVVIQNDSTGSAWTFGSSNWTATGITDTWVDVMVLPDRPQTS